MTNICRETGLDEANAESWSTFDATRVDPAPDSRPGSSGSTAYSASTDNTVDGTVSRSSTATRCRSWTADRHHGCHVSDISAAILQARNSQNLEAESRASDAHGSKIQLAWEFIL